MLRCRITGPAVKAIGAAPGPQLAREGFEEAAAGGTAPGGGGDALGEARRMASVALLGSAGPSTNGADLDDLDGRLLAGAGERLIAVQQQLGGSSSRCSSDRSERPRGIPAESLGDDVETGRFDDGDGGLGDRGRRSSPARGWSASPARRACAARPHRPHRSRAASASRLRQRRRLIGRCATERPASAHSSRMPCRPFSACPSCSRRPPLLPDCAAILGKARLRRPCAMSGG